MPQVGTSTKKIRNESLLFSIRMTQSLPPLSVSMQIKLALAWNRIDVAKTCIFTDEDRTEDVSGIYESMTAALLDNKFEFVELFLSEGIHLDHFLTLEVYFLLSFLLVLTNFAREKNTLFS